MTSTVESVDNLSKPPPHERVNASERSSAEDQRKQFKKALKETVQEDLREDDQGPPTDSVVIELPRRNERQSRHRKSQAAPAEPDLDEVKKEGHNPTSVEKHIDVRA